MATGLALLPHCLFGHKKVFKNPIVHQMLFPLDYICYTYNTCVTVEDMLIAIKKGKVPRGGGMGEHISKRHEQNK